MRPSQRSLYFAAIAAGLLCLPDAALANSMTPLQKKINDAVVILAGQTEDGGLKMLCTATAFEKKGDLYRFVTAAHCVADDDTGHKRVAVAQTNWYVTFDEVGLKEFHPAKILYVGYQSRGDDFAILEAVLKREIPVIPLAERDGEKGEAIDNVAAPLALGKQLFDGHVSLDDLDRPVIQGSINWWHATLLQVNVGPGSSGSAVVSRKQEAIIAILVGNVSFRSSPNVVAIPVTKLRRFLKDAKCGKYEWFDGDGSGNSASKTPTVNQLYQKVLTRFKSPLDIEKLGRPDVVEPSEQ